MSTTDSVPSLTPNQILVLVVLMAEAREVTNNELKDLAGFTLTGEDNKKLETKLGLVETDRSHKPFSHRLTGQGRHFVSQLPDTTPPKQGGSSIRTLFTLLANTGRALDRLQISYDEFFEQRATTTQVKASAAVLVGDVEVRIREAYEALPKRTDGWLRLSDLRATLGDLDNAAVDDVLRAMARKPGVRIIPVADSQSLDSRDRAAAVRIGGEDNHQLKIEPA